MVCRLLIWNDGFQETKREVVEKNTRQEKRGRQRRLEVFFGKQEGLSSIKPGTPRNLPLMN